MRLSQILESSTPIPEYLYYGTREAMIAELGTGDYYTGKYLVQPVGNSQWDAEGVDTIKDLKMLIQSYMIDYPSIKPIAL